MRRRSRLAASTVAVTLIGSFGAALTAAPAYADTVGKLCANTGTGGCLAPDGPSAAGVPLVTYPQNEPSASWSQSEAGTVTSDSPFSDQALDTQFLGDRVLQFASAPKPALCVANIPDSNDGQLKLEPCGAQASEYFVVDAHRYINVQESDIQGAVSELTNTPITIGLSRLVYDALPGQGGVTYGDQHWSLDPVPTSG